MELCRESSPPGPLSHILFQFLCYFPFSCSRFCLGVNSTGSKSVKVMSGAGIIVDYFKDHTVVNGV